MSDSSDQGALPFPTSSAEGSPVRTSALPEPAAGSRASGPGSGSSSPGWSVTYDRDSSSWRTSPRFDGADSEPFSGTWPRAGTMRCGTAFPRAPSAPLTAVTGSSWSRGEYPTPSATSYGTSQNEGQVAHHRPNTAGTPSLETWARRLWPTPTSGDRKRSGSRGTNAHPGTHLTDATCRDGLLDPEPTSGEGSPRTLNPRFVLWLMGFPLTYFDQRFARPETLSLFPSRKSSDES